MIIALYGTRTIKNNLIIEEHQLCDILYDNNSFFESLYKEYIGDIKPIKVRRINDIYIIKNKSIEDIYAYSNRFKEKIKEIERYKNDKRITNNFRIKLFFKFYLDGRTILPIEII